MRRQHVCMWRLRPMLATAEHWHRVKLFCKLQKPLIKFGAGAYWSREDAALSEAHSSHQWKGRIYSRASLWSERPIKQTANAPLDPGLVPYWTSPRLCSQHAWRVVQAPAEAEDRRAWCITLREPTDSLWWWMAWLWSAFYTYTIYITLSSGVWRGCCARTSSQLGTSAHTHTNACRWVCVDMHSVATVHRWGGSGNNKRKGVNSLLQPCHVRSISQINPLLKRRWHSHTSPSRPLSFMDTWWHVKSDFEPYLRTLKFIHVCPVTTAE